MYTDVLIPTDGSDHVEPAIQYGLSLAYRYDATIHALHVVDSSPVERKLELTAENADTEPFPDTWDGTGDTATRRIAKQTFELPAEKPVKHRENDCGCMESHEHGRHDPPRGYGPSGHATLGGLSVDADGLRLVPSSTHFTSGTPADWSFQVVSSNGAVATDFDEAHGQRSHLIVVRRDLTQFQHLHPTLDSDGTWRVEAFTLPEPGVYRAFVDLVVDGTPTTLGFDLFVSGAMEVAPRPDVSRRATTNGYDVGLQTDEIRAGETVELVFEIGRDGDPVTRLDPYLGALGHLVALREGDLAYLHAHPEETSPDSGRVEFGARFPTPGRYRLFLQTKPDGSLITTQHDIRIEDG